MDTFMLRLGAHYGPTVVSTEVQEQNLTWVQTGHAVPPNQTTRFTVIPKNRCFCIQQWSHCPGHVPAQVQPCSELKLTIEPRPTIPGFS